MLGLILVAGMGIPVVLSGYRAMRSVTLSARG